MSMFVIRITTNHTDKDLCLAKKVEDMPEMISIGQEVCDSNFDTNWFMAFVFSNAPMMVAVLEEDSFPKDHVFTLFVGTLAAAMRDLSPEERDLMIEKIDAGEAMELHCNLDGEENEIVWRLYASKKQR